jgi:alpha-glucosidase
MQWSAANNADFSTGAPWLPIAEDFTTVNVALAKNQEDSLLALYRRLIELRRSEPALAIGAYQSLQATGDVLAYTRQSAGSNSFLVALNFGPTCAQFSRDFTGGKLVLSSYLDRANQIIEGPIELRPQEGIIVALPSDGT